MSIASWSGTGEPAASPVGRRSSRISRKCFAGSRVLKLASFSLPKRQQDNVGYLAGMESRTFVCPLTAGACFASCLAYPLPFHIARKTGCMLRAFRADVLFCPTSRYRKAQSFTSPATLRFIFTSIGQKPLPHRDLPPGIRHRNEKVPKLVQVRTNLATSRLRMIRICRLSS